MADFLKIPPGSDLKTFQFDEDLPALPLPSLHHTLDRYLDSVRPFVNDKEYAHTEELVKKFADGQGKELHQLLIQRASKSKNWLDEWWRNYAYLENRQPLMPFCNMIGVSEMEDCGWKPCDGTMIKRTALYLYYTTEMWDLLRKEQFMPDQTADGKTKFCMAQYRHLYNCNRYPLPKRDRLDTFFKTESEGLCPSHVIVQCNGQLYVVDAVNSLTGVLLTPPEWELQLQIIFSDAEHNPGPGLGRLTCDNRDVWAENRAYLQTLSPDNSHYLDLIDTAIYVACLDSDFPVNDSELIHAQLCGDYSNRWADKSTQLVFFRSGMMGGVSEHSAYDGFISIVTLTYIFTNIKHVGGVYKGPDVVGLMKKPKRLDFVLDDKIRSELVDAEIRQKPMRESTLIVRQRFPDFGKNAIIKHRIHPDTFIQLSLQLAYYSIHGCLAPCYETATTRGFYNGRTETHRSCTNQAAKWVYAMNDSSVTTSEKVQLLIEAVKRNDELMKEARVNKGCDRHLFGLYCIALESGLPIPEIFSDPSYFKSGGGGNYVLSTSLVGFYPSGGGVGAMTKEGYGVFYNIRPDSIWFILAVQRHGETTSTNKFFQMLSLKLNELMKFIESVAPQKETKSKI